MIKWALSRRQWRAWDLSVADLSGCSCGEEGGGWRLQGGHAVSQARCDGTWPRAVEGRVGGKGSKVSPATSECLVKGVLTEVTSPDGLLGPG